MSYDRMYREIENVFGDKPEEILINYHHMLRKDIPVLDIGIGQGRNSLYLAKKGFYVHGIDTLKVSIDTVNRLALKEDLSIQVYQSGFYDFMPQVDFYSAILVFGLIQMLSWEEIKSLSEKLKSWTEKGSILFITAFTTEDPAYHKTDGNKIGKNSFSDEKGNITTYLEKDELKKLFEDFKILHYREFIGPEHRHGDGPLEKHGKVEAVFQR